MKAVLIVVALCAFAAAAMVPKERRAINTEEEEHHQAPPAPKQSTTQKVTTICARQTPCGWSIYRPVSKIIETNLTNTYCICGEGTVCVANEDDSSVNAYIHHCLKPEEIVDRFDR